MGQGGQYLNPSRVFKKNLKPVPNLFIKIELCPIRGGTRRVPEKTHPIVISNLTRRSKSLLILTQTQYDRKNLDLSISQAQIRLGTRITILGFF